MNKLKRNKIKSMIIAIVGVFLTAIVAVIFLVNAQLSEIDRIIGTVALLAFFSCASKIILDETAFFMSFEDDLPQTKEDLPKNEKTKQ